MSRATAPLWKAADRVRFGIFGPFITRSRSIRGGWSSPAERHELIRTASALDDDAVIVEVGVFVGASTVLLAGGRKIAGSGTVHAVDPFDASGESFSTPIYERHASELPHSLREQFEHNVASCGVAEHVVAHQGLGQDVACDFDGSVDMLFLDGAFTEELAEEIYEAWIGKVEPGGTVALHNSVDRKSGHDGNTLLAERRLRAPDFDDVRLVGTTTFAVKR